MAEPGWTRRLDDRVDLALKRRFGTGLVGGTEPSLGKHLAMAVLGSGAVALVLLVALVASGQGARGGLVVGPVVGATLGVLLGRLVRDARRRRQDRTP